MIKQIKVVIKFILLLSPIMFVTSCFREFEYEGDYPELFSVAVNSILGAIGYSLGPPGGVQPRITLLEEDAYGRRLFLYNEEVTLNISAYRIIIQKIEGNYAYFYPHYNFISSSIEYRWEFTDEDMEALKKTNSWNQEMNDSSEFVRVRIVRKKEVGPISNERLIEVYSYIFLRRSLVHQNISNSLMIFLRTDSYGRSVYAAIGPRDDDIFAVLFHPNHSFDPETGILLIEDRNRYQTALRLFMEANGWNTPFMIEEL